MPATHNRPAVHTSLSPSLPQTAPHNSSTSRKKASAGVRLPPAALNEAKADAYGMTPLEESFRHSGWRARRARVYEAMGAGGCSTRRRCNFATCGANAIVMVESTTGAVRVQSCVCKDRMCEPCQSARSARLQRALAARIPRAKCLHVVLTIRSTDAPLGDQLDRLYKASSRLRQGKWWKARVDGGFQTLELTINKDSGQWHPHLHCLVHAEWLAQAELSAEWAKASGGSTIVHVSLVRNEASAIREVTKYAAKPIHRSIDFSAARIIELMHALAGRHLCATWGSWRKDPLLKTDAADPDEHWTVWGTLNHLAMGAARGSLWEQLAMRHLVARARGSHADPLPPPSAGP